MSEIPHLLVHEHMFDTVHLKNFDKSFLSIHFHFITPV